LEFKNLLFEAHEYANKKGDYQPKLIFLLVNLFTYLL